jgi:hypothetical protein
MADSSISNLPRVGSVSTTMIIPVASLSNATTLGLSIQSLWLGTRIVGRDVAVANINNSAATTSIYSVKVPANALGTDRILRTRILGEYFHSVGATATMNLRIGLSTTTMYQDATAAIAVSANSRPMFLNLDLVNQNSQSVQVLGGKMEMGAGGATTGEGDAATAAPTDVVIRGVGAVATSSDVTFDVFITHSVASTLVRFTKWYGYSEIV